MALKKLVSLLIIIILTTSLHSMEPGDDECLWNPEISKKIESIVQQATAKGVKEGIRNATPQQNWLDFFWGYKFWIGCGTMVSLAIWKYSKSVATKRDLKISSENIQNEVGRKLKQDHQEVLRKYDTLQSSLQQTEVQASLLDQKIKDFEIFLSNDQKSQKESLIRTSEQLVCVKSSLKESLEQKGRELADWLKRGEFSCQFETTLDDFKQHIQDAKKNHAEALNQELKQFEEFYEFANTIKLEQQKNSTFLENKFDPLLLNLGTIGQYNEQLLSDYSRLQSKFTELIHKNEEERDKNAILYLESKLEDLKELSKKTKSKTGALDKNIGITEAKIAETKELMAEALHLIGGQIVVGPSKRQIQSSQDVFNFMQSSLQSNSCSQLLLTDKK